MTVGLLVNGNLGVLEYTRGIPGGWSPVSGRDHVLLLDTWILDHDSDALYSSHSGPPKHSHCHTHNKDLYYLIINNSSNNFSPINITGQIEHTEKSSSSRA